MEVWGRRCVESLLLAQKNQLVVRSRHLLLSLQPHILRGSPSVSVKEPAVPRAQLCGPWGCDLVKPTRAEQDLRARFVIQMGLLQHMLTAPHPPREDPHFVPAALKVRANAAGP